MLSENSNLLSKKIPKITTTTSVANVLTQTNDKEKTNEENSETNLLDVLECGINAEVATKFNQICRKVALMNINTDPNRETRDNNNTLASALVYLGKMTKEQANKKATECRSTYHQSVLGKNIRKNNDLKVDKAKRKLCDLEKSANRAGKLSNVVKQNLFHKPKQVLRNRRVAQGMKTLYKKKRKEAQRALSLARHGSKMRHMEKFIEGEIEDLYSESSSSGGEDISNVDSDGFDSDLELTQLRLERLPSVPETCFTLPGRE